MTRVGRLRWRKRSLPGPSTKSEPVTERPIRRALVLRMTFPPVAAVASALTADRVAAPAYSSTGRPNAEAFTVGLP
jgi:hypothetical protein